MAFDESQGAAFYEAFDAVVDDCDVGLEGFCGEVCVLTCQLCVCVFLRLWCTH